MLSSSLISNGSNVGEEQEGGEEKPPDVQDLDPPLNFVIATYRARLTCCNLTSILACSPLKSRSWIVTQPTIYIII
jgi:hypothetical protein